jgi:hypothetical protein
MKNCTKRGYFIQENVEIQFIDSCNNCLPAKSSKIPAFLSLIDLVLPKCPFCY